MKIPGFILSDGESFDRHENNQMKRHLAEISKPTRSFWSACKVRRNVERFKNYTFDLKKTVTITS